MTLLPYLAFLLSLPLLSFAQDLHRGDFFPGFELKDGLSKKDYDYLKLSAGSIFGKARTNLTDINVDLLFVEFLNKYCIVCQQDAPEFAKFSQEIEADQGLRGKVKVLGVAVGNNTKEVENFKNEYSIGFPVIPDPESSVYRKIGSPRGSPLVYVLKKKDGRWLVIDGFKGEAKYADILMRAKIDLEIEPGNIKRSVLWTEEPLRKTTEPEVRRLLAARMPGARILKTIPFDNGDLFVIRKKKETLFAKSEARKIICDVCHDASFIYIFDHKGTVRDFIPVNLSKAGNLPFSRADVDRIRKNIVGRNMLTPFKFDKEVDAVTSATLTSLVIYDSVYHGKELLSVVEKESP
jgi:thiol-disulfide isomerase/thioredoxin